jgi:hypothetical protein
MEIEDFLERVGRNPSIWTKVWLFFFLLTNRKEGRQLIETLIEKMDEFIKVEAEIKRKADALYERTEAYRASKAM